MTSFHVASRMDSSSWGRKWLANNMYMDSVNVGPIWTAWDCDCDIAYWVSPAVRNVLAWRSREGDTVAGKLVDSFAPDVVMARFMSGTASSMRTSKALISSTMCLISAWIWERSCGDLDPFFSFSSDAAALPIRCPRAWISQRRDFVRATADSSEVLPRAALIAG